MLKFKLQTGNLPAPITSLLFPTERGKEFTNEAPSGKRWTFVNYKVSKEVADKAKTEDVTVPQPFACAVDSFSFDAIVAAEKGKEMLVSLFNDYQDSVVIDSANGKSMIYANDIDQLIADYFDASRKRNAPTQEDILKWYDDTFAVAYVVRVEERNAAETNLTGKQSAEATKRVVDGYRNYVKMITGKSCSLEPQLISGVRQTIERLQELGHIDADDKMAAFVVEKCIVRTAKVEAIIADVG